MKPKQILQQNFWSGIIDDIRGNLASGFWYSENLEITGKALKQVANNQAENVCNYATANFITKLIQNGTDIYGLGQDNATNKDVTIWKKTNALDGAWGIPTNGTVAGTTFAADNPLFAVLNGDIFFDAGNGSVGKYTIATNTMNATWKTGASMKGGTIWQGKIYGWIGQDIYVIDPVADTLTNMKSVSTEQTIVELVPYGNLLCVVCTSTVTISRAYLWDGVSTTSWVEVLEIGQGQVSGGANLEGTIIVAISTPNKRKLKLKAYSGVYFRTLYTYSARKNLAGTSAYVMPASRLKVFDGFVYLIITGTQPNGSYAGLYEYAIARFGREDANNPMAFSIYKTLDFSSARSIDGQTINNDFTILENIVSASNTVEKAVAAVIYSALNNSTFFLASTSTYSGQAGVLETFVFDGGDASIEKQLIGVSVFTEALASAGKVVCKYKKDEETAWTTIFTNTTGNSVSYEAVSIESTGVTLPTFKKIQFRIEVIGNTTITGFKFKFEPTEQIF